jgi:hypothetical protein
MRKPFAIGTLLLSSAAVMVSQAATSDRNAFNNQNHSQGYSVPAPVTNQNFGRGYVAPAPNYSSYTERGRLDREAQARLDRRLREERLERERRERARHNWRFFGSYRDGY